MRVKRFNVVKFLSLGDYSALYEIVYPEADDKISTTKWVLKRFYLRNRCAVWRALREQSILARLAQAEQQSPFLCTLLQSFQLRGGPALVLSKGSGFNLQDLIASVDYFQEDEVRFYSCEIISGIEHLHAMHIVHLDLCLENVLLADSGHIFITNFDCAFDMTRSSQPFILNELIESYGLKSANMEDVIEITTKTDVRDLGALVYAMINPHPELHHMLRTGLFGGVDLLHPLKPLLDFLEACLRSDHNKRVDIHGVKRLQFFKDVKWEDVVACKMQPPYQPSQIELRDHDKQKLDPTHRLLLATVHRKCKPLGSNKWETFYDRNEVLRLKEEPTSRRGLLRAGLTPVRIKELFANFNFTNPQLLPSRHGVDGSQVVSGDRGNSSKCKQDE